MIMPLPPGTRVPLWATRRFRRHVIAGVVALSAVGVVIFEIMPMMRRPRARSAEPADPAALLPGPAAGFKEVRFDGVLDKVRDGTPIDERGEPYYTLIRHLAKARPEDLAKDARQVSYGLFSRVPADLRGLTVRILALYMRTDYVQIEKEKGGVEYVRRVYLSDVSGTEGYVVDLVEPPPAVEWRSLVAIDAVFLKMATYEGKKGPVQAPLFVGRNLRRVKERSVGGMFDTGSAIAGTAAMVAVLAAFFFSTRIRRKAGMRKPLGGS